MLFRSWDEARSAVDAALHELVSPRELAAALASASEFVDSGETLSRGSGWGALEIEAGSLAAVPGLPFGSCDTAQRPWLELLGSGRLPVCDPPAAPVVGPRWRELLEARAEDWHALYHLGLMRLADGDDAAARDAFERSVGERPTPWALRALGFLAGSAEEAADLAAEAHRLLPELRELTIEALDALLRADRSGEALALIEALPQADRQHGRIRLAQARAAHASGDDERVRVLLAEGVRVDNMREGELSLDALWAAVHPGQPVPAAYDFRMSEG